VTRGNNSVDFWAAKTYNEKAIIRIQAALDMPAITRQPKTQPKNLEVSKQHWLCEAARKVDRKQKRLINYGDAYRNQIIPGKRPDPYHGGLDYPLVTPYVIK
jgi:hypothetical protein